MKKVIVVLLVLMLMLVTVTIIGACKPANVSVSDGAQTAYLGPVKASAETGGLTAGLALRQDVAARRSISQGARVETAATVYDPLSSDTYGDGNAGDIAADLSGGEITWAYLLTQAGAICFTIAATQFLKVRWVFKKLEPGLIAYIVAVLTQIGATVFTGNITASAITLCFFNGIVVAIAASGAYDKLNKPQE